MNINLVSALIGVFVSALTSFYISTRQSKIEIQKLRDEYSHRYAGKIFEKRLEAYPKLVEHLVVFFQKVNLSRIKRGPRYQTKVADIKNLLQVLLDWDAQNAILYSVELQNLMHDAHRNLYKIINKPNDELRHLVADDEFLLELRNELFKLFLALKNDLGIYSFESPSVITGFKSPNTVKDFAKSQGRI
jgi:hypothetical protein